MKRFILETAPNAGGMIRLYEKDYHYLVRVRRLKTGMCFEAVLPNGEETIVRILSTVDKILIGECLGTPEGNAGRPLSATPLAPEGNAGRPLSATPLAPKTSLTQVRASSLSATPLPVRASPSLAPAQAPLPAIALFQALPRGSKMDLIVRQAAEGGVSLIVPFESDYSTAHLNKNPGEKMKRWEKIVKEARQQSGSSVETKILPPGNFRSLLDYWEKIKLDYRRPAGILLHQEPLEKGSFHGYLGTDPDFAALAVGPEGGFSPGEVSLLLAAGFRPLLMGDTVLRTETAALYGTAAIRIILLEREAWIPRQAE